MAELLDLGETFGGTPQPDDKGFGGLPHIDDPEEAAKLPPGTEFLSPKGKGTVPYRPKDPDEAATLPEGSTFITPEGRRMKTPTYEGLDFTSQTLYNMAVNDKERRKILERGYPGKVKDNERTGEMYVDDDGVRRRSKGFSQRPAEFFAAQAAPVAGSMAGERIGGALGSVVGPAGTFGGAVAGGALGGAAGQYFNDSMMALAGVYDRSGGEEAKELALSGGMGGVGTAVGRGIAAVAPAVKGAIQNSVPKALASFLGADEAGVEQALTLREKGALVPPSGWAKEAPALQNIVEVYDPHFRTQKPLLQSTTAHYEKGSKDILGQVGVSDVESLTKPEAAVSTEKAGEAVIGRTRDELRKADEELRKALEGRRAGLAGAAEAKATGKQSLVLDTERAATEARKAAQAVVDEGFQTIRESSDAAMSAAKAGHNSGDLWWAVGEQLKAVRAGIASRANKMYGEADDLAGGLMPDMGDLPERANAFLQQLPEGFEGKYPAIVKQLRDLSGVENEKGEVIKEAVNPTWAQLHNLRSVMRMNYNSLDLTPDIKQGAFKHFALKVDEILHSETAVPELRQASKQLRAADDFYRENMGPLNDRRIQAVMDGLDSGLPADPKVLFDTIVKDGRSDLTKKISEMVGPNLWAGVKAADVREILEQSKSIDPGSIDGKRFVGQILERYRNGMLEAVHGQDMSAKLLRQAQAVEALNGRLDLPVRPGDTVSDVINKAKIAAEAAKEAGKKDPLGTLAKEMQGIERQLQNTQAIARKNLKANSQLGFLYDPSIGASQAVDKILGSEDLIVAAASKFGENSTEFKLLRQVWVERIFTGTLQPGTKLEKVTEEVQKLMLPNASLDDTRTLVKEMDFLMSARGGANTATSIAAQARINNPWGHIVGAKGIIGEAIGSVTGLTKLDPAGRAILTKYYATVTNIMNSTTFLRFVLKGLKGDENARAMVKAEVQRRMNIGGTIGAGVGEFMGQQPQ